jgi:hypothetical protein
LRSRSWTTYGQFDEATASPNRPFFIVVHAKSKEHPMSIRPLLTILTELSAAIKTLADQHVPPIPFDEELEMGDHALQRGSEPLAFRAIEVLVLAAHASGLTKEPALQRAPAYIEAVQVLRMSGKPLPADL